MDGVAREILQSILSGRLKPGQPFSMAELSSELGVSHIPVREALRRLEGQGFVELRPSRSAVVAPMDIDDVREIYRLRRLIEVDAIGRAAQRYADSDIAQMRALLAKLEQPITDEEHGEEYWSAHYEFQLALVAPGAAGWTALVLRLLWQASERYYRLLLYDKELLTVPKGEHSLFIAAAEQRDRRRLQQLTARHLTTSLQQIINAIARLDAEQSMRPVTDAERGHQPDT